MSCATYVNNFNIVVVSSMGIVFNLMSTVCIGQIIWLKGDSSSAQNTVSNMFSYLLIKAVCDLFVFVNGLADVITLLCGPGTCAGYLAGTLSFNVWLLYIFKVAVQITLQLSSLMEVFTCLDCYLYITSRFTFVVKKSAFWVVLAFSLAFSVLVESWRFPSYYPIKRVYSVKVNDTIVLNETYYAPFYDAFSHGPIYTTMNVVQTFFRDVFLCAVILAVNTLILFQMRKTTRRRVALTGGPTNESTVVVGTTQIARSVKVALKAERKKSTMIVLTGVNYITGHIVWPIVLIIYLDYSYIMNYGVLLCLYTTFRMLLYVPYITPFFFYYFFNTHFKRLTNRNLRFLFYPVVVIYEGATGRQRQGEGTDGGTEGENTRIK